MLLAACTTAGPVPPVAAQNVPDQITDLAERGKFDELAHVVAKLPQTEDTREVAAWIQAYLQHLKQRRAAQLEAYQKAKDEAVKLIGEDKPEEAMVKVIEAHSLAEHPDKLLNSEEIANLIKEVEGRAKASMQNDDIVEGVSLYRLLDLLYEDTRKYRDDYLDAATKVRVLQTYNPTYLRDLYKQRAERLGNEEDLELFEETNEQELDDWTVKLEGIETSMLGIVFTLAAEQHIDKDGYVTLVKGAAEELSLMIQTKGLDGIFPGLGDADKVKSMQAKLDEVLEGLDRPGRRLTRAAAMSTLAEIMQTNTLTVGLPENVIVYELATGGIDLLDSFSNVIWPEELPQFIRGLKGHFFGIGVQIQKIDGKLTVVTPLENSPAIKAGLKANDVIARVEGIPTGTWTVDRAVREITGPENTKVNLTIHREDADPFDVELIRKPIKVDSIKGFSHRDGGGWNYWIDKDSGLGYIRMTQFLRQTADDMDKAIKQMQEEAQLKGVILDLRFNPGGLLTAAIDIVDRFIDNGRIVATVDGNGFITSSRSAIRTNTYDKDLELVVLINQGSASASEIVSGALQDYERATILGENSYGKGSVQDIMYVGKTAAFKCTTQYYQLPKGKIIHRKDTSKTWGIQPDLEVKMSNTEVADWLEARRDADILIAKEDRDPENPQTDPRDILADGLDPQLEAAVLLLKAKQVASKVELAQKDE